MAQSELATPRMPSPSQEGSPEISVVVPVYNEERTLEEVYRQTVEALEAWDDRTR